MGGKGRNRNQQNAWNSQVQQDQATARAQNQQITQVDPLEAAYRAKQQRVLDWENSSGKDIRNMPGMDEHIQIGQAALNRANQERYGTGALNLGGAEGSGYAAKLKEQRQAQMGQEVGVGLENARAGIHSEAAGSVMPLSQLSTNRRLGQAQHSLGIANTSAGMFGQWNQRKSKNWWDYLGEGIGMASQVGGMLM
jgi:hypothetical protein